MIDVQTGELLGPNQDGEVCIKGPTVMKGQDNTVSTFSLSQIYLYTTFVNRTEAIALFKNTQSQLKSMELL